MICENPWWFIYELQISNSHRSNLRFIDLFFQNALVEYIGVLQTPTTIGGSRGHAPLRVQILSFWHTNFMKRSHFWSPCPPMRSTPPLREILDLPLITFILWLLVNQCSMRVNQKSKSKNVWRKGTYFRVRDRFVIYCQNNDLFHPKTMISQCKISIDSHYKISAA